MDGNVLILLRRALQLIGLVFDEVVKMTFKEAAERIAQHNIIHQRKEYPFAIKITEALDMATKLLLWMDKQPEWILDGNIVDLLNEYYESGCSVGFDRAKKVYNIKD